MRSAILCNYLAVVTLFCALFIWRIFIPRVRSRGSRNVTATLFAAKVFYNIDTILIDFTSILDVHDFDVVDVYDFDVVDVHDFDVVDVHDFDVVGVVVPKLIQLIILSRCLLKMLQLQAVARDTATEGK